MPRELFGLLYLECSDVRSIPLFVELLESIEDAHRCLTNLTFALRGVGESLVTNRSISRATPIEAYKHFETRSQRDRNLIESETKLGRLIANRIPHIPIVHRGDLLVYKVSMHSPLDLSFIGNLNPLEVIRNYLKDRHERKMDRAYKSPLEAEQLQLKNLLLRSQVESASIDNWERLLRIARENGATETQIQKLLDSRIAPALSRLGYTADALGFGIKDGRVEPLSSASPEWDHALKDFQAADRDDA